MKKTLKTKAVSVLLTAMLVLLLLSLASCTRGDVKPYEWGANSDRSKIWNEDRTYYIYEIPDEYRVQLAPRYEFQKDVEFDEDDYYTNTVYSYARDGEIISVYNYDKSRYDYYATEAGCKMIDELVGGSYENAYIYYDSGLANLGEWAIDELDRLNDGKTTVDVRDLRYCDRYMIRTYDDSRTVYSTYGAVYFYDGGLWYVNYSRLSNDHFDANGNFSYRSGEVTLYMIPTNRMLFKVISECEENMEEIPSETIREKRDLKKQNKVEIDPVARDKTIFWIVYSLLSFVLPAWPLIVGLQNARSPKHGRGKYWYIVSIGSGVWILLGLVMVFIIT